MGDVVVVVVWEWWVEVRWGEDERRRENIDVFWGAAGGGEGERRDPKMGIVVVCEGIKISS